jgi:hypothetical protein
MSDYICKKPISLSGRQFAPGDVIPAEAIMPGRVLALTRSSYIVPMSEEASAQKASNSPQNDDFDSYPITLPFTTPEGLLQATVSSKSVVSAISILQLPEKEEKEKIAEVADDDVLMILDAVERRKAVLTAVKERHNALAAKAGDADGENV